MIRGASAIVVSDGPAAAAGLETGDVITAVDGRKVTSPGAITALILAKKPGATVTVRYVDQTGTASTAKVRLGSGPPR